jgi:hypothetical protein
MIGPNRLTLVGILGSFHYYVYNLSFLHTQLSISSVHAQATSGSGDFTCSASTVEGVFECTYNENFPFAGTQSGLIVACGSDTIVEPSPDICGAECLVVIGDNDVVIGGCSSCEIIPDANPTDGTFQLAYDCSNILEGNCVGRTTGGACISNLPGNAPSNTGDGGAFVCVPGTAGTEVEGQFGCVYPPEPYPFSDRESFLFAICPQDATGSTISTDCDCAVFLGSFADNANAEICNGCVFLDNSFTIAFDCGYVYRCHIFHASLFYLFLVFIRPNHSP